MRTKSAYMPNAWHDTQDGHFVRVFGPRGANAEDEVHWMDHAREAAELGYSPKYGLGDGSDWQHPWGAHTWVFV